MLYRPEYGRIKDSCTIYDDGRFYLFGMFGDKPADPEYNQVWMACSCDGVHWQDGSPVIKAPFPVWAMNVVKINGIFWLNHGSFADDGTQSIIRFWSSDDLRHWTYHPELDLRPDTRFFPVNSRLDCMDVARIDEEGTPCYYGFATGPGGFLKSEDGIHWRGCGPVGFEWNGCLPPLSTVKGDLEIGGCRKIGDAWYLLAGCFNLSGACGYATIVLKADSPDGPFRLDTPRYRLYGSSGRWVSFWTRFCETPDGMLISNSYIYNGYSYENGETWIPPLKRACIDTNQHLYLGYWNGNDALKGEAIPMAESVEITAPSQSVFLAPAPGTDMEQSAESVVFDPMDGAILEGSLMIDSGGWIDAAPGAGFYFEEEVGTGTAILLETSGITRVGRAYFTNKHSNLEVETDVNDSCASVSGVEADKTHWFRLLFRRGMFELYVDERHCVTFNCAHGADSIGGMAGTLRFLVNGGHAVFSGLRVWKMNLENCNE